MKLKKIARTFLTSAGDTFERDGEKLVPRAFNTVVKTLYTHTHA